jgi:cell division protein FtsB
MDLRLDERARLGIAFGTGAAGWFYRFRRKLATAGVAVLACWLAIHVLFGANGMVVYQKKRAEFRALQQETERVQKENEKILERVKALKSDPSTIEKEAREQLRYAKPGEVVYVLPAPQGRPDTATAQQRK